VTGGFSAEYGSALSGVVSYVTRRGSEDRWEGAMSLRSDHVAPASASTGRRSVVCSRPRCSITASSASSTPRSSSTTPTAGSRSGIGLPWAR